MANTILATNAKGRQKSFTQMQWNNMPEDNEGKRYGWVAAGSENFTAPVKSEPKVSLPEKVSIKSEIPAEVLNPPVVAKEPKTAPKAKAKSKKK